MNYPHPPNFCIFAEEKCSVFRWVLDCMLGRYSLSTSLLFYYWYYGTYVDLTFLMRNFHHWDNFVMGDEENTSTYWLPMNIALGREEQKCCQAIIMHYRIMYIFGVGIYIGGPVTLSKLPPKSFFSLIDSRCVLVVW